MGTINFIYNVNYEVASILFMLCLAAYVGLQYNLKTNRNKQFYIMVWIVIIASIFDVVTAITNGNTDKVPLWINLLLNSVYFWLDGILAYQFVNYAATFIGLKPSRSKRLRVLSQVLIFIYTLLLLVNSFTNIIFSFNDGVYQHEALYFLIYFVPYMLFVIAWIMVLIGSFKMGTREKLSSIIYVIFSMSGVVLQIVFFPTVLLTLFTISLASVIVLFFLESNDYVEMSKMLEQNIKMNEATGIALDTKNRFLQNINDNVASPIKRIIDHTEAIAKDIGETDDIKAITEICVSVLTKMDDAVEYSALEISEMEIFHREYEVRKMVDTFIMRVRDKIEEKGLKVELQVMDVPETLWGDRTKITQIVHKILTNAVQYTDEGTITVRVLTSDINKDEVMLTISVEDTGCGIPKEKQDTIFYAFERAGEGATNGLGLGLTFAKLMTEHLGGNIGVYSEEGKGTLVYIEVPQRKIQ